MYSPSPLLSPNHSPFKASRSPFTASHSPFKDMGASRSTTINSPSSPYMTRVKSIGKKLNNLQTTIDRNQAAIRTDQLENRIREIDAKVTANHYVTEEKIKNCEHVIDGVEEAVAAEIISRELLEERKLKEMRLVESNLALELRNEKRDHKEVERKMLSKVELQILAVRSSFVTEQKRLEDIRNDNTPIIGEKVSVLQETLKEDIAIREQAQNKLLKKVNTSLSHFREVLDAERKIRNECENFFCRKMEDISAELQKQVIAEVEKRERVESQMLLLLEAACHKLEGFVRPY